jgi:hypothetical protein
LADRQTAISWMIRAVPAGVIAAALILLALSVTVPRTKVLPLEVYDQGFYLGIAYDLRHSQSFTNGYYFQEMSQDTPRPPGMRFTPLYPGLLAIAAEFDPAFATSMDCVVTSRGADPSCSRDAGLVRRTQYGMLGVCFWLIWWIARKVTESPRCGWLALALALATAPYLVGFANDLMTEITALFLITCATAAVLRGLERWQSVWLGAAGLLAGGAALTRPAFLYLFFASLLAAGLVQLVRGRPGGWRGWLAFAAGGAMVVAPWIIRNAIVLHVPALTAGYGPQVLVQRLAFDQMDWSEWRLSFLCWLPDGNGLGNLLFGHGACGRFGWIDQPNTFYEIGNGPLMQHSLAAAGGWANMMGYLVQTMILPDLLKYAMVTLTLALRGAWVNHYWGLVLMPVCLVITITAVRRGNWRFLVVSLPAWFMLLFTAAVAVNQTRYNLTLVLPFAVSGAITIERCLTRHAVRRLLADRDGDAIKL